MLRCDIYRYFPAIDYEILKQDIRRRVTCLRTLNLVDRIIDASNPQEPVNIYFPGDEVFTPLGRRRGISTGNLTSQFLQTYILTALITTAKKCCVRKAMCGMLMNSHCSTTSGLGWNNGSWQFPDTLNVADCYCTRERRLLQPPMKMLFFLALFYCPMVPGVCRRRTFGVFAGVCVNCGKVAGNNRITCAEVGQRVAA